MLTHFKNRVFKAVKPLLKVPLRSFCTVQTAQEVPGDLDEMNHAILTDYTAPLLEVREKYGPIFQQLTVFGPTIVFSEVDDIRFALSQEAEGNTDAIGFSPAQWEFISVRDALFTHHSRYRKSINRALSKTNLTEFLKDIQNLTTDHMEYIIKNPAEEFYQSLLHYTVGASTMLNFGPNVYSVEETQDFVQQIENYSMFLFMQDKDDEFGQICYPAKEYIDKLSIKHLKPYLWDAETGENYDEAIKNRQKLEEDIESGKAPICVSNIMAVTKDDDGNYLFNGKQLYSITCDAFSAAAETVTSAMIFACYSLATNPRCHAKLKEELSNFEYVDNDGYITDIFKFMELPYLDSFINESIRIYGFNGFFRVIKNDIVYKNLLLPEGHSILFRPVDRRLNPDKYWPIQQNFSQEEIDQFTKESNVFEEIADGTAFIPERWMTRDGELNKLTVDHKYIFLPFGVGKHICAGRYLAQLELKLFIRELVMNYKLNIDSNMEDIEYSMGIQPKLTYKASIERL